MAFCSAWIRYLLVSAIRNLEASSVVVPHEKFCVWICLCGAVVLSVVRKKELFLPLCLFAVVGISASYKQMEPPLLLLRKNLFLYSSSSIAADIYSTVHC